MKAEQEYKIHETDLESNESEINNYAVQFRKDSWNTLIQARCKILFKQQSYLQNVPFIYHFTGDTYQIITRNEVQHNNNNGRKKLNKTYTEKMHQR